MKKLVYITYEFFLYLDKIIVTELNKKYDLTWIIFSKFNGAQNYTYDEIVDFARESNIKTKIFTLNARYRSIEQFRNAYKCIRLAKKMNPDIYYFQSFTDPYSPLLSRLFLKRDKVVVAVHDVHEHSRSNSFFKRITKAYYLSAYKNFHIYSENQRELFLKHYPRKTVMMARLPLYDFGPPKTKKTDKKFNFLFFGVIMYYKGVGLLIEAANMLAREFDNFKVTIAGHTEDFTPYGSKIEDESIFDLRIELIPNEEIPELFAQASFLIQPYRDVTQSGPLKIAYHYAIPCIASRLPGFTEYIEDGVTGYLFEACNAKDLYRVMKKVVSEPESEIEVMRKNLKEYVEDDLGLDAIISNYVAFFNTL